MNFVLHHFVARRDLASGAAGAGAMLPDLWRMADRRARPAQGDVASDEPRVRDVLAGIAHHVAIDRAFHACAPFVDGERATARALAEVGAPKLALFGHVAWELCLDGALVRREGGARLVATIGDDLAGARAAIDEATRLHLAARDRVASAELAPRLARLFAEIARGPWVAGYAHGAGLTARLEGVRARLGLPPLAAAERDALAARLDALLARADAALDAVLALREPLR